MFKYTLQKNNKRLEEKMYYTRVIKGNSYGTSLDHTVGSQNSLKLLVPMAPNRKWEYT